MLPICIFAIKLHQPVLSLQGLFKSLNDWLCADEEGHTGQSSWCQFSPRMIPWGFRLAWEASWEPAHADTLYTWSLRQ